MYPRSTYPGSGLGAFKLAEILAFPCLYIAKKLDGTPVPFPRHVRPYFISYLEPESPQKSGLTGRLFRGVLRLLGNAWLVARGVAPAVRFRPDLIHIHTPLPIALGLAVKSVCRCPIVLSFQGTDYYRFLRHRWLQRVVSATVDQVVCVSKEMADDFAAHVPGVPVTYIPNGVDIAAFSPATGARKLQIVTVGRLVWQKAYDDLLSAFAGVLLQFPSYHLVIAGTGILESSLREQARSLGIESKVTFAGTLPQDKLTSLLRESKLFVLSSVSEGFSKALVEALACGVPAVATNVGGAEDAVQASGIVVAPKNPDALRDAMCEMLSNSDKWNAAADAAVENAARFSWEVIAQRYANLYQEVLTRHRARNQKTA